MFRVNVWISMVCLGLGLGNSQVGSMEAAASHDIKGFLTEFTERTTEEGSLGSNELTYVLVKAPAGFQNSVNFHYSPTFTLREGNVLNVFGKFTGEFDFYMFGGDDERDSGPVINRKSNPGLHLRTSWLLTAPDKTVLKWWGVGLEHLSNGQVGDHKDLVPDPSNPSEDVSRAQLEYEMGNEEYFDTLSRGSNFVSFEAFWEFDGNSSPDRSFGLWTKGKVFLSHSSEITWGEYAQIDRSIVDYHFADIVLTRYMSSTGGILDEWFLKVKYSFGSKFFKTDSLDFSAYGKFKVCNKFYLPLYFRAHRGPNAVFSDYTTTRNSWGFGLIFN